MAGNFSIPGIGSGIDWGQYIDSIRQSETQAIARTLGKRQGQVSAEQAVIGNIKGLMQGLKTAANSFEFAKDFKTKTVTCSDTEAISGTATVGAINQAFQASVETLATNEVWQASFTGVDNSVTATDQTLTINVRGTNRVLTVTAGTTLKQLADQINNAGIGLSAVVFDTGAGGATPARLSITDNTTGKANANQTAGINFNLGFTSNLTALNTASFGVAPTIEGVDSKIIVGTTTIYRDSNTVQDVFPGVTLTLKKADPGVNKTVTIGENTEDAAGKLTNFLNQYNNVIAELRKAVAYDPTQTEQTNPTAGNSTLRSVLEELTGTATGGVGSLPADKTIRSLADIGITSTFNKDDQTSNGQLNFDEEKFNKVLKDNFDDVVTFFEGVKVGSTGQVTYDGFGQKFSKVIDGMMDTTDGTLSVKLKSLGDEGRRIDEEMKAKLKRIDEKEQVLKDKFARLESQLSQLNGQQSSLTSAIQSISLNSQAIANKK